MDLACPKEQATEIWGDSDHSTMVKSTILKVGDQCKNFRLTPNKSGLLWAWT